MRLEITRYEWQLIDGQPKIVISMVKVMEDSGKYVKFAKLKEILPELSKHPVTFKKLEDGRELPNIVDYKELPF